jgi:hypothetical protein
VTSRSVGGVPRAHALYPVFSITNHCCVANTRHGREGEAFCLVATVDIAKGEEVTTAYNSPGLGSIARRPQFRQLWHFDCCCRRCADPAELGSLASALACPACPAHLLPTAPLDAQSDWICQRYAVYLAYFVCLVYLVSGRCGASIPPAEAERVTAEARGIEEAGRGGVEVDSSSSSSSTSCSGT